MKTTLKVCFYAVTVWNAADYLFLSKMLHQLTMNVFTLFYGMEMARTYQLFHYPHALVPISMGMRTVKLCSHKILHFLTGSAS